MTRVGPLNWNVPIVNKDGTPTREFMMKWVLQASVNGSIPALSTPEQVSAVLDILGGTEGDILRRGASEWGVVHTDGNPAKYLDGAGSYTIPPGTFALPSQTGHAGEFLSTDGAVTSWQAAGGGGGGAVAKLASGTFANDPNLTLDISAYGAYSRLKLDFNAVIPSVNGPEVRLIVSRDGGVTYDAGGGDYWTLSNGFYVGSGGGPGTDGVNGITSFINITGNGGGGPGNGAAAGFDATLTMANWSNAAQFFRVATEAYTFWSSNLILIRTGVGLRAATGAVDHLRVYPSAGNWATGKWVLYGWQ